jgi:hypothetical protein
MTAATTPRSCKHLNRHLAASGLPYEVVRYTYHAGQYFAVSGPGTEMWRSTIIIGPCRLSDLTLDKWLQYVIEHRDLHQETP